MLKADEKFLYVLLTLSQEQNIKTGPLLDDLRRRGGRLATPTRTSISAFVGNKKSEALQDRIILVKVPYNLRVTRRGARSTRSCSSRARCRDVHIAPHTLRVASIFAVLTRLEPSKKAGMSLMKKLKLYDGEDVEASSRRTSRSCRRRRTREGMDGISPRYVINRLSSALVREGVTCINPIDALRALRDGLEQHTSITREQREHYLNLIAEARKEYDEMAKKEVQRAFVYSFEESAQDAAEQLPGQRRGVLQQDQGARPDHRRGGRAGRAADALDRGADRRHREREEGLPRGDPDPHLVAGAARPDLRLHQRTSGCSEAIEKKLFADLRDVVKITTSAPRRPTPSSSSGSTRSSTASSASTATAPICANELLKYVGSLLNR